MSSNPVLLIHGAWQGAWSWVRLTPILEREGLQVIQANLPGNGTDGSDPALITLQAYLDYLDKLIEGFDEISVVGHSGGGMIGSALGEHNMRVARIAYVAGMMMPAGRTFAEVRAEGMNGSDAMPGVAPFLRWSRDGLVSSVPEKVAQEIFFSDCPPEAARNAAALLTPQGDGARSIQLGSVERVKKLPRLYIEAAKDRSVPLGVQRLMQALMPGALVATLPSGHAPQLSMPQELAQILLPFLKGARDCEKP